MQRPLQSPTAVAQRRRVMASPASRRRAREAGIDLAHVQGRSARSHHAQTSTRCERAVRPRPARRPRRGGGTAAAHGHEEIRSSRAARDREPHDGGERNIPHFAFTSRSGRHRARVAAQHLNAKVPQAGHSSLTCRSDRCAGARARGLPECNACSTPSQRRDPPPRRAHGRRHADADGLKCRGAHAEARSLWDLADEASASPRPPSGRPPRRSSAVRHHGHTSAGSAASSPPIINAPEMGIIASQGHRAPVVLTARSSAPGS